MRLLNVSTALTRFTTNHRSLIHLVVGALTLGLLLEMFGMAPVVNAHAYPVRSVPANGDALTTAPKAVTIWFSEMVAAGQSKIDVFDSNFIQVDLKDSHVGSQDQNQLIVSLPQNLPAGTYTVRWSAGSAMDGHHTSGAFVFAVGGSVSVSAAAAVVHANVPIDPLSTAVAWFDTLTLTTLSGVILIGFLVLRPTLTADRIPVARLQWLIYGIALLNVLSAVAGLFASQLQTYDLATVLRDKLWLVVLTTTRFGSIWWIRMALTIALIGWATFWEADQPLRARSQRIWLIGCALACGLLLTLSLNSHSAGALWAGLSIAVDWAHLLAVSAWIGGLITLTAVLPALAATERWQVLRSFSALATLCVVGVTVTGFYNAALHLYQVEELWQSDYGRWLCVKLAIVVVLLLLGLNNKLALRSPGPRPARSPTDCGGATSVT